VLGRDLEEVTGEGLDSLIGWAYEDEDLEFKREMWATSRRDRKELAADVAQFANHRGGFLIVGMEEDDEGVAQAIAPLADDGRDRALWVDQVIAGLVAPLVRVQQRQIDHTAGPVHLISVERSPLAPHAVRRGNSLGYPVRFGRQKRWLPEAEVADSYRRRVAAAQDLRAASSELQERATDLISEPAVVRFDRTVVWLLMTAVPDSPGQLGLRADSAAKAREWLNREIQGFPSYDHDAVDVQPAFRALRFGQNWIGKLAAITLAGELRLDGSSFVCSEMGGTRIDEHDPEASAAVYDEHLVGAIVNGLAVTARHADQSGASGGLNISAELFGPAQASMYLTQYRNWRGGEPLDGTESVGRATPVAVHSAPLDLLLAPGPEVVSLARLLLADLMSAFGLAEPLQIAEDLTLNRQMFHREWQSRLEAWCKAAGVEITPPPE
jgi:hypothetical protein